MHRPPQLRDFSEDDLVARLCRMCPAGPGLRVGPGDDCAVLDPPARGAFELLKTDALVEQVHFDPAAPPAAVGWKAVARVFSDFAAMGGWPRQVLVTLGLRPDQPVAWLDGLYRGIRRCARRFGAGVAGGELTRVPPGGHVWISVAAVGQVARKARVGRDGGQPGDVLAVTGRLGGSLRGRHLRFTPRLAEAAWLVADPGRRPHAMIDLSDGLARDLPRLARASRCGFDLDLGAIPRNRGCDTPAALADGEDYELLVAVPRSRWDALEAAWPRQFPRPPLTRIGRLTKGPAPPLAGGWDHFAAQNHNS